MGVYSREGLRRDLEPSGRAHHWLRAVGLPGFTPGSFGAVREDGPNVVYKLSRGIARCYGLRAAIVNDGAV